MLEVHIPQKPGETMTDLRRRVRTYCESNRVPFEQGGQVPQALAIFVADEATRASVEQGLAVATTAAQPGPSAIEAPAPAPAAKQQPAEGESQGVPRRGTLRPTSSGS